jgi:Alternaria alternata allergen 1
MHLQLLPLLVAIIPLVASSPVNDDRRWFGWGGHHWPTENACPNDCLEKSLHNFTLTISYFEYSAFWYFTTPSHQNSWGTVNFTVWNPAVATAINCKMESDRLQDFFYGDQWYDCLPASSLPANVSALSFRFNAVNPTRLDVNQTWKCDDARANKPSVFYPSYSLSSQYPSFLFPMKKDLIIYKRISIH